MSVSQDEKRDKRVEDALFKRCIGYDKNVSKPIKLKRITYSESGRKLAEEEFVEYAKESKYIEPNVSAIAMYLKNRMPNKWGNMPDAELTQIALEVLED
ncbi:MAG: hypothetical protein R3Y32_03555 [Bacillota bacterium]